MSPNNTRSSFGNVSALLFLCAAAVLFMASEAAAAKQADAPLIIRPVGKADPALKLAVDELAHYLQKSSGLAVSTTSNSDSKRFSKAVQVFHIGTWEELRKAGIKLNGAPPKGEEVYAAEIQARGKQMETVLSGETPTATLFAVYAYLEERVGVRWYFPGEVGEHVQRGVRFPVPASGLRSSPGYTFRWFGLNPERVADAETARTWARRNRLNVDVGDGTGLNVLWWHHTFHDLLPPSKFAKEHPEFYAERNGKRGKSQLCTSNPKTVSAVVQAIRRELDANPAINVITLDPQDGGGFCQCAQCVALDEPDTGLRVRGINPNALSRRLMIFYTQVAREVNKTHPKVQIKSLVYNWYSQPPADPGLKAEANMMLMLAHSACHNHPLEDPDCPTNLSYNRFLKEWLERAENVGFYEYYHKDSWISLPFPIAHSLKRDIPYAHKLGVRAMQSQFSTDIGPNGWIYFLAAKLLWNPGYDADAGFLEFCANMYGKAAPHVEQYHRTIEERFIKSNMHIALTGAPYYEIAQLFDAKTVNTMESLLAKARQAETDPAVHRRLDLLQIGVQYTRAVAEYFRELLVVFDRMDQLTAEEHDRFAAMAKTIERIRRSPLGLIALGVPPEPERPNGGAGYGYSKRLVNPKGAAAFLISQIQARYASTEPQEAPWAAELARRIEHLKPARGSVEEQAGR